MFSQLPIFLKMPCDSIVGSVTRVKVSNSFTHFCSWKGRIWCALNVCRHGIGIVAKPVLNLVGAVQGAAIGIGVFLPVVAVISMFKCDPCYLARKTYWVAAYVGGLLGNSAVSLFCETLNMMKAGAGVFHPAAYYRPLISDDAYLLKEAQRLKNLGMLTDAESSGFKTFLEKVNAGSSDPRSRLVFAEMQRNLTSLAQAWGDTKDENGNVFIEDSKRVEAIKDFVSASAKCPAVWSDECALYANSAVLPADPQKLFSYFVAEAKDEVLRNLVASTNISDENGEIREEFKVPYSLYKQKIDSLLGYLGYGNTSMHEANIYRQMIYDALGDVKIDLARNDPSLQVDVDAAKNLGLQRHYLEKFLAVFTEQYLVDYMFQIINGFEPGRKQWREKLLWGEDGLSPLCDTSEETKKNAIDNGYVLSENLEGEMSCLFTKKAVTELLKSEIEQLKKASEKVCSLPQRKDSTRWIRLGGFEKTLEEFTALYYIKLL